MMTKQCRRINAVLIKYMQEEYYEPRPDCLTQIEENGHAQQELWDTLVSTYVSVSTDDSVCLCWMTAHNGSTRTHMNPKS